MTCHCANAQVNAIERHEPFRVNLQSQRACICHISFHRSNMEMHMHMHMHMMMQGNECQSINTVLVLWFSFEFGPNQSNLSLIIR